VSARQPATDTLTQVPLCFPDRSHRPRAFERKRRGEIRAPRRRILAIPGTISG